MNVRILGVFTAPNGQKLVDYMAREVVRVTNGPYPPLVNQPFRERLSVTEMRKVSIA
jgi:hypothetical protein